MTTAFGIDLGTTNSSIARLEAGRPVAIPIEGHPLVPSVVLFQDDRVIVGREALNCELEYPGATIRSVKRRMGTEHVYDLPGGTRTPDEVAAEILRALKVGAERSTGETVRDVVITVPAYFDDAQRRATLRAGELAGLNVLRLLNEPTSASLVYDHVGAESAAETPELVMVYDLGGGTFDVSILEVCGSIREVRATAGNTHLGGDDFDEALVRLFVDELKGRRGVDPTGDARAMVRLRRLAEETKIRLSIDTSAQARAEFIASDGRGKPVHLELEVTRREFEHRILSFLESSIRLCRQALDDAHLEGQTLSRVCLVGGSTRIPMCRSLLGGAFGVGIHEEVDPDLAVALGAAIQAGLLTGANVDRILVDVASHSLGIRVLGEDDDPYGEEDPDTFAPVLHHNTVLPAARTEEFYTMVDEQAALNVEVFQGESRRVSGNAFIGSFHFPLIARPAGSPVRVEFAYDLNGVVKVRVSQPGTDNSKLVALSVADAGERTQSSAKATPVERKARALLARLGDGDKAVLTRLLDAYVAAAGEARLTAEEKLLDFFIDVEDRDGDEGLERRAASDDDEAV